MLLGTQRVNSYGHLEIGGCDTTWLADEFGTPLYVLDEAAIRANCRSYRTAFESCYPQNRICYAGKALLTRAICKIVQEEGFNLDVAALGELYTALSAGFPARSINLHGNNKSSEELELAVSKRVGHIVLDNFLEIEMLRSIARKGYRRVNVLVRVTPGIDPHTHKLIRTGQADTKFGFNIRDGAALTAVRQVIAAPELHFKGIHCHVGSQLLETDAQVQAVHIMVKFMHTIRQHTGVTAGELNIGGGLGVRYIESHRPPSFQEYAEAITGELISALNRYKLPYPILVQEPGRSIIGETGTTLYTIGAIKTVPIKSKPGHRTYVAVDGGMSDNPRPQLYDAVYQAILADYADRPAERIVTIAGKHCETDILIWDTLIAEPHTGDILAVQTTGAYNFSMASNYNKFQRPAVVLVNEGQADLIVARESLRDLIRNDRIPDRLKATRRTPAISARYSQPEPIRS